MKKKKLIIIIAAALALVLALGGIFLLKGKKPSKKAAENLDVPMEYTTGDAKVPAMIPKEIQISMPPTPEQQAAALAEREKKEAEEAEKARLAAMSRKERSAEKKAKKAKEKAEKKAEKEREKAEKKARKEAEKELKKAQEAAEEAEALGIEPDAKTLEILAKAEEAEAEAKALAEKEKEEEELPPTTSVIYRYEFLPDLVETVASYVEFLLTEEQGYAMVDKTLLPVLEVPELRVPAGMLTLAKNCSTPGMVTTVDLAWRGDVCLVTVTCKPGAVRERKPLELMTALEAVDYMKRLEPEFLGLSGESMEAYQVYALDGAVLINNRPCFRIHVYQDVGGEAGKEIVGQYYLSSDGEHLYRQEANGDVSSLPREELPHSQDVIQTEEET